MIAFCYYIKTTIRFLCKRWSNLKSQIFSCLSGKKLLIIYLKRNIIINITYQNISWGGNSIPFIVLTNQKFFVILKTSFTIRLN